MKIGWILKKCDKFVYMSCPNTGMKFREPYHSNHVIPTVQNFQMTPSALLKGRVPISVWIRVLGNRQCQEKVGEF